MKKILVIIILVCMAPLVQSCTKSCTCVNPDTDKTTEIDIDPAENCSAYSNADRGSCS